jgi:UDP-glucose 4-epimerase
LKKAIVTGATGFVGKWVVRELLNNGVEVIAIAREGSKKLSIFEGLSVKVVECNLNHLAKLPELISDRDIDIVYHFAWQGISDADTKDSVIQIQNLQATLDVLNAMTVMGIKAFVGAGSLHEAESQLEMMDNKVISNLGYMYKAAKIAAHYMGKAKAGDSKIKFFWPIISNTYGEGEESGRLINMVIRKVLVGESPDLSSGEQYYDFVHISDVAKAFYLIGEKGKNGSNYIIGSGYARPLKEFLSEVGRIANPNVELGFGKIKASVVNMPHETFNMTNLIEDTGFEPKVSFEEGITRTVEWIKKDINKDRKFNATF